MSIAETAKNLTAAMQPKTGPQPYDTQATVVRVEDDTLWVHIPGGVEETPVQRTINAAEGDVIQIRVGGGSAWVVGNASAPPTDDARANVAHDVAVEAEETAQEALELARLKVGYAEIGEAVIGSLEANGVNADWINAGTLDAARIAANSISTDKLTVGQGGNLYPVYDSFEQVTNDNLYFGKDSTTTPTILKSQYARNGSKVLRIATATGATNAWVSLGAASNDYGLVRLPASQYVASAYFRRYNMATDVPVRLTVIGKQTLDGSLATGEWTRLAYADKTMTITGWTRVEVPFTVDSGTTYPYVHLRPAVLVGDATVYVDCLQIEAVSAGQGAGEWHPAGVTQIDGGNIVAQSIKADSLDVNDLFAEDITATGEFAVDNENYSITASGYAVDIQGKTNLGGVTVGNITCSPGTPRIGGNAIVTAMKKTVTGTTTSNGNLNLDLSANNFAVLSVWRSDASSCCIPYTTAAGNWYARVQSTGASPSAVASTSVTVEVVYCQHVVVRPMGV